MIYIDLSSSINKLTELLSLNKILYKNEMILAMDRAGEGNMNVVIKVKTNRRSFIFKQSRPYVEKYQNIPAPIDRIDVEYNFYSTIHGLNHRSNFPRIIFYCSKNHYIVQEYIEDSDDFLGNYIKRKIDYSKVLKLTKILKNIHESRHNINYPLNDELKKLNHQHIFILPFIKENGFSLDSIQVGLEKVAHSFIDNELLKNKSLIIGNEYLKKGKTLLHGDYYPGSWLQNNQEIYIIDPEFSFIGDLEFDLGVFIAHIIIITQKEQCLSEIIRYYSGQINKELLLNYTAIEIIRRIIGLAQIPIDLSLNEKENLLNFSKQLLLN